MVPVLRLRMMVAAMALVLTACAVGPDYRPPRTAAPAAWSAPLPHDGSTTGLIGWWNRFDDPVLTRLLRSAEAGSPSLAAAWANIRAARATLADSRADGLPNLSGGGTAQRSKEGTGTGTGGGVANSLSGTLDASWEIDLFGKVRRSNEAAQARIAARTDDWHDARVSLAAEVADTYVQFRACRLLADAYADEARSQTETARATATAVRAGLTSDIDGALEQASAASLRSTLVEQRAACDVLVKALVALTGEQEPTLRHLFDQGTPALPAPAAFAVDHVPAALLAQRPDLASLERELAAASAEIGAAEADRYPSLTFSGEIGRSGSGLGSLMTGWLLGPVVSLPVFDAGKRAAAVDSAEAAYEARLAAYRDGVRTALKEVEQALVRLDGATRRTADAEAAARGYRTYFEAVDRNWRAGGASLLDREEARRSALAAEIETITLRRDQIQYWIALYKALGGGWRPDTPARSPGPATDIPS
ncbi:efflux transporter outer membrane subunit [Azospirillum sp. ST 5-10]|uniref:efflux transporter outer membrane subunit n=1 Tax=unclassified Azospirillum TaxID=2630922 RepID=UPI003F4A462E